MKNTKASSDLMQGTLDLLILRTLALEPQHGWAIAKRIEQLSKTALQVQQGSLYPALYRLEERGWIKGQWKTGETARPTKVYSLTAAGRRQLAEERARWEQVSAGINLVLSAGGEAQ